jgi:hypothetical protein
MNGEKMGNMTVNSQGESKESLIVLMIEHMPLSAVSVVS